MIELKSRLATVAGTVHAQLKLTFDLRQKSRLRTKLVDGEEAWLMMPRGEILRGGDLLQAVDGRIVEVVSETEDVLHVTCVDAAALARAAYHLGNRHVPVQIGDGWLRFQADKVLGQMLVGLGVEVSTLTAPFEPEAGAYAGGHHHHSMDAKHSGIIHDFRHFKKP